MGLLTFALNVTLDGCIDHRAGIPDDELHDYFTSLMDGAGAMLFGRTTYELMETAWPAVARDEMPNLAPLLAKHFTVFTYDRRGRGASGDTKPYAKERELDGLAALIDVAGGSASLLGLSSGAALALEAAAAGLPACDVIAYEPPYVEERSGAAPDHRSRLEELVAGGRRGDAVRYFMRDMVGVPGAMVFVMRLMFPVWRKLQAVAHTLPYDAAVMGDFAAPTERLASIRTRTLVMHGAKTDARLQRAALAVAAAIPGAQHRTLAGQNHNVNPRVLAPAVIEFLSP